MKGYHFITLFLILSLCTSKVMFTNLNHKFIPSNQKEYLNYIQLMIGQHQQSTILSQNLRQVLKQQRPSIFNTPKQFVLYVISSSHLGEGSANYNNGLQEGNQMNGQLLSQELKTIAKDISIKIIKNGEIKNIQQIKKNHQERSEIVHVMEVDHDQMRHFESLVPIQSSQRRLQQKPVGQTAAATDSTYLIKFFFSIIFVIVIIAIIGFITDGSSKKDTLLYAKFIADVGNR